MGLAHPPGEMRLSAGMACSRLRLPRGQAPQATMQKAAQSQRRRALPASGDSRRPGLAEACRMGLATQKEAAASRPAASENWCRGRDLNSHGVATATSRQRVYQFHHPDARNASTASPPPWQALFLLSSRICRLSPAGATRAATLVLGKCRAFSAWQPVRLAGCRSAGRQGSLHETCSCQQAQTCYGPGRQQKPSLRAGRRRGMAWRKRAACCPEAAQNLPKICPELPKNAQDERQAGMLGAQEQCGAGRPVALALAAPVRCAACLAWQARGTAWMPMRNQACPLERTWRRERAQKRSVAGAACGTGVNLGLLREGRTCMDKKDLHG